MKSREDEGEHEDWECQKKSKNPKIASDYTPGKSLLACNSKPKTPKFLAPPIHQSAML
jgi:hypothetical protein